MALGAAFFVEFYAHLINNGTARRAEYLYPFDPSKKYESDYDVLNRAV
jgi:magnesium-transporting ATPase (P-type)